MPYTMFRRHPVPQEYEQHLQPTTIPAPTRGIIMSENDAFMAAGGAIVQDNWASTMRGVKLRGGCERWCDLHALDVPIPPVPDPLRKPVISAFEYVSGANQRMFAAQETKLFEVTTAVPALVKSGQHSGNYAAAQMSNAAGEWLIAVNDAGDPPLRFNGTAWHTLDGTATDPGDGASGITNIPPGGLTYVWKYRNRLYFIGAHSMSAWYLPLDSVGGPLLEIPLSGAAARGGHLLFGATWSLDAGDGIDEKNVFGTDLGEVLIFTGTNPGDPDNWRQEGRYGVSAPLGMNAHIAIGGDLLILTVDGIVPLSQAITKDAGQLELALLTRAIKPIWRAEVADKRDQFWTIRKWDEYGSIFVATPGGKPGARGCLVAHNVTTAWSRFVGWDAMCFLRLRADMFFGTQDGIIMEADQSGTDDGVPYVATVVGGWEMFGAPTSEIVWHQARAVFRSSAGEPFQPQLSATIDYVITIPPPPPAGPDQGVVDVWDQGVWGPGNPPNWPNPGDPGDPQVPPTPAERLAYAQWDQPSVSQPPVRNTLWESIGMTGFAHAPIVQITVAQRVKPNVELLAIGATFERAGVNV